MKLLLDTHTIIWHTGENPQLSENATNAIDFFENEKFVSIVSFWEIAIKYSYGKAVLPIPLEEFIATVLRAHSVVLPIDIDSILLLESLPQHHRDPFDRMLIAQAKKHGLTIVSRDPKFQAYEVPVLW